MKKEDGATRFEPWASPSTQPFIEIRNVSKQFDDFVALQDVSLKIYKGELFALLGGSGCGKTTLLRMIAGFETPTQGRIIIDGQDMTDVPPYARPVNMMFQSYALFPHMTVFDNVAYGLKREGVPKPQIADRVKGVLDLVQMGAFVGRKPHQLSGGQRQRVALARALVKEPKALLLDEPLAALDKKLREQTQYELMNIQDKVGITFIVVTHDQEEAMTLSTRIAVMNKGQVYQVGRPAEVYEYPNSRFTANFIGTANIFEAQVVGTDEGWLSAYCAEIDTNLVIAHGGGMLPPGAVVGVAVRPEKMRLSREPRPDALNQIVGQVWEVGYFGGSSSYRVKIPGGKLISVTQTNFERLAELKIDWDEEVYITFEPASAVLLTE